VASLGSAGFVWVILGQARPRSQMLGTLLYLWNPMIIVEFASEGHNDSLMIFLVLAALALAIHARPAASVMALILGVLTKYLPLILLPAQVIYLWRTRQRRPPKILPFTLLVTGGLALMALIIQPLWAG